MIASWDIGMVTQEVGASPSAVYGEINFALLGCVLFLGQIGREWSRKKPLPSPHLPPSGDDSILGYQGMVTQGGTFRPLCWAKLISPYAGAFHFWRKTGDNGLESGPCLVGRAKLISPYGKKPLTSYVFRFAGLWSGGLCQPASILECARLRPLVVKIVLRGILAMS